MKVRTWSYEYSGHIPTYLHGIAQKVCDCLPCDDWPEESQEYWDRLEKHVDLALSGIFSDEDEKSRVKNMLNESISLVYLISS
jgi:hypothetical protein